MKDRILQVIDYYGLNKNKFYVKTGLSNGFLDKEGSIRVDKLEKILESFPEINSRWLITGEGQMIIPNSKSVIENYIVSVESKMATAPVNLNPKKNRSEEDELLIKFLIGKNKELELENEKLKSLK